MTPTEWTPALAAQFRRAEDRMSRGELYKRRCVECGRVFDLTDDDDAAEWAYGHDCEE